MKGESKIYIITIISNVLSLGRWPKCPVLSHHLLFRVRTFFQIVFCIIHCFQIVFRHHPRFTIFLNINVKVEAQRFLLKCGSVFWGHHSPFRNNNYIHLERWSEWKKNISFIFLTLEFINNATQSSEKVDQLFHSQSKNSNLHSSHRISLNLNIKMIKITK